MLIALCVTYVLMYYILPVQSEADLLANLTDETMIC